MGAGALAFGGGRLARVLIALDPAMVTVSGAATTLTRWHRVFRLKSSVKKGGECAKICERKKQHALSLILLAVLRVQRPWSRHELVRRRRL